MPSAGHCCAKNKMNVIKCHLDELGYCFVKKCIETIETRGLDDQGLYRIGGVNSRVTKLLQMCLDRKNYNPTTAQVTMPDFSDPVVWETKTITSALKNYLRNLSEPLMTYNLHPSIIEAAKIENAEPRTDRIKSLIQQLPASNFNLLRILVEHLKNVASHSQKNLMTVSNLGICFAPTLMRGPEENALSIMEIKYSNVVATTLIEDYESIFNDSPMNRSQQQLYQNSPQPIRYTPAIHHAINNHDDQFGLGLPPSQQYLSPNQPIWSNEWHHNSPQPLRYTPAIHHAINNHDDQFGLGLPPSQQYLNPHQPIWSNEWHRPVKVITLYACVADTESELSFGPNEVITDVRHSAEVGWLVGTLERSGQRGLLPENYVKFI